MRSLIPPADGTPEGYNVPAVKEAGKSKHRELILEPEELVYRSCYAPVSLSDLLATAETRSKIRRLPPPQLFFSLKELDDEEIIRLLPHVTEEQWTAILDLDLWDKDEVSLERFVGWERHLFGCEGAVARKILRATDPELWQLAFRRELRIFPRVEEDEFEQDLAEGRGSLVTPDGEFLIVLPGDMEKARLFHQLILKVYETDPDTARNWLHSSQMRTSIELEEEAYQNRRRRIEDMGFQDYFDAIEIYTPRSVSDRIPEKQWEQKIGISTLPSVLPAEEEGLLLLFRALSFVASDQEIQSLIEELFFVCNKLLSADRISPGEPESIKKGLRKAIGGINLGLECWSESDPLRAVEGIREHYLLSYFQIGYGQLLTFQENARERCEKKAPPAGTFLEAFWEGIGARYPKLTEQKQGKIVRRYFETRSDFEWADRLLDEICEGI
jgi:hypothetical protein